VTAGLVGKCQNTNGLHTTETVGVNVRAVSHVGVSLRAGEMLRYSRHADAGVINTDLCIVPVCTAHGTISYAGGTVSKA